MANLEQLKKELLADGIIDSEEVKTIKAVIYEDGKIDKDEADFLFELNDAVSGKENAPEWAKKEFEDVMKSSMEFRELVDDEPGEDKRTRIY